MLLMFGNVLLASIVEFRVFHSVQGLPFVANPPDGDYRVDLIKKQIESQKEDLKRSEEWMAKAKTKAKDKAQAKLRDKRWDELEAEEQEAAEASHYTNPKKPRTMAPSLCRETYRHSHSHAVLSVCLSAKHGPCVGLHTISDERPLPRLRRRLRRRLRKRPP